MAAGWYFLDGDVEQGPVPFSDLEQRAAEGRLRAEDLVWTEGMTDWDRAGSIAALIGEFWPCRKCGQVFDLFDPATHCVRGDAHASDVSCPVCGLGFGPYDQWVH